MKREGFCDYKSHICTSFFSFLLVILFSKVTYNHYVGIALTAALLFASYMKGYTETYFIVGLDIISLVAGALFMAKKEIEKREKLKKKSMMSSPSRA
ncbi:hypothetical protein BsIDN1_61590 [Bacillus safensis]|uniref:DUF2198 domain-containing protein n=1 Tax=Bacillus safensis TaxID=561879 RepID=A0A5S9MHW7_BACIA|nr:hypothetical protein BsIDN1_61590 [Bacillus safensis]